MVRERYYFSNRYDLSDDDLSELAVKGKEIVQQIDQIIKIFKINNEKLYGSPPRNVLLSFSPSSSNDISLRDAESYEGMMTPSRCNPVDDAEKKEHHSTTFEFDTQFGNQKPIDQTADETSLSNTINRTCTSDEQFSSQVGSKGNQEASALAEIAMSTNLTIRDSPSKVVSGNNASNVRSPRTIEIAKESLKKIKEPLISPAKVVGSFDASCQEIPTSFDVSVVNATLAMAEKDSRKPTKEVGKIKLEDQETPQSSEIITMATSLTADDKKSRNLIPTFDLQKCSTPTKRGKIAENSLEDTLVNISPIAGAELNISSIETPKVIARGDRKRKSLSSARRRTTLFKSVPRVQAENSPEDTKETASHISGTQLNISPIETPKGIARDDRESKSLTPREGSTEFLKLMPRVIKLAGDKFDIEVDLNFEANPTPPRSKSADYQSDSTKENVKSPADGASKTDTSSKAPERYLHPSQKMSLSDSSSNISGTYNPVGDDEVYAGKNPTGNLSIKAPESIALANRPIDLSCRNEIITAFVSFQKFQSSITFINSYVHEVLHFILTLDCLGKCVTEELKNIVRDARAISDKLINMLQSWEKDVDSVISTWYECFQQTEELKAQNGPLFTDEGETAETFEAVREYVSEMQAIWGKMDDMGMQVDSIRALFSLNALDVEKLTIMLVKCFTLVGILKLR